MPETATGRRKKGLTLPISVLISTHLGAAVRISVDVLHQLLDLARRSGVHWRIYGRLRLWEHVWHQQVVPLHRLHRAGSYAEAVAWQIHDCARRAEWRHLPISGSAAAVAGSLPASSSCCGIVSFYQGLHVSRTLCGPSAVSATTCSWLQCRCLIRLE